MQSTLFYQMQCRTTKEAGSVQLDKFKHRNHSSVSERWNMECSIVLANHQILTILTLSRACLVPVNLQQNHLRPNLKKQRFLYTCFFCMPIIDMKSPLHKCKHQRSLFAEEKKTSKILVKYLSTGCHAFPIVQFDILLTPLPWKRDSKNVKGDEYK